MRRAPFVGYKIPTPASAHCAMQPERSRYASASFKPFGERGGAGDKTTHAPCPSEARCPCLGVIPMPVRGLFLPSRDDAPRQVHNVPAWKGLRAFSQKLGRFRRNVPARERSGRATSPLGRDGEKGHRVYLRERRGPPLPEAASFSQVGTLRRKAADSPLRQQSFSQARTMGQFCDATSLLGRSADARREASLPRRVDGQPWSAHCLRLGEKSTSGKRISLPRRADGRPQAAQRLCLGEVGVCKIPALKCGWPFRVLRVFVAQRPCLKERCAYTRKTGAWDETRPGKGKGKEEQGQAWKRNEATRKAEPLLPGLCGLVAGAENYLKWWPRWFGEPWSGRLPWLPVAG